MTARSHAIHRVLWHLRLWLPMLVVAAAAASVVLWKQDGRFAPDWVVGRQLDYSHETTSPGALYYLLQFQMIDWGWRYNSRNYALDPDFVPFEEETWQQLTEGVPRSMRSPLIGVQNREHAEAIAFDLRNLHIYLNSHDWRLSSWRSLVWAGVFALAWVIAMSPVAYLRALRPALVQAIRMFLVGRRAASQWAVRLATEAKGSEHLPNRRE